MALGDDAVEGLDVSKEFHDEVDGVTVLRSLASVRSSVKAMQRRGEKQHGTPASFKVGDAGVEEDRLVRREEIKRSLSL